MMAGKEYHRLTVIGVVPGKANRCVCRCQCGSLLYSHSYRVLTGNTKSCGCLKKDQTAAIKSTHGMSKSKEYRCWQSMKERCYSGDWRVNAGYKKRGIVVCDRWLERFENFYADMGPMPTPKHTVERVDNNGNYCPENCKWATKQEQTRNTSRNVHIEVNGCRKTRSEWSRVGGISEEAIKYRLSIGKSPVESIFAHKLSYHNCKRMTDDEVREYTETAYNKWKSSEEGQT